MKKILIFAIFFCVLNVFIISAQNKLHSPPNILVFIADDAGMDFGCYGNEGIKTPNIDKLANEGIKFNKAFLTTSQCSPSRTSLLSGQFSHTVGTADLHLPLDSLVKIVPHYLQQKNYFTGIMMKTHIGKYGMQQFNWYDNGMADNRQGKWNDKVLENFQGFLDATETKPFFMWCAFTDPHKPYREGKNGAPIVHGPQDVTVPPYFVDSKRTREELACYYDEIHRLDKHIGIMLHELERRGLAENTLVVFLSDNGFPFPRGKATVYDSGIQTPLVMKWDNHIDPGSSYDGLTSLIDFAPTLLKVAGAEIPAEMYGKSIEPVFTDQTVPGRKYIFSERNWHDSEAYMRCIRSNKYKLIYNGYANLPFPITGDFWESGTWFDLVEGKENGTLNQSQQQLFEFPRYSCELYDIENDPYELTNLSNNPDYSTILENLYDELSKWQDETGDFSPSEKILIEDIVDRKSGFLYGLKKFKLKLQTEF